MINISCINVKIKCYPMYSSVQYMYRIAGCFNFKLLWLCNVTSSKIIVPIYFVFFLVFSFRHLLKWSGKKSFNKNVNHNGIFYMYMYDFYREVVFCNIKSTEAKRSFSQKESFEKHTKNHTRKDLKVIVLKLSNCIF